MACEGDLKMNWLLEELRFEIVDFRERLGFWIRPGRSYDDVYDAYHDIKGELAVEQQVAMKDCDWERVKTIRSLRREFDELGMELGGHFKPALPPGEESMIEAAAVALPVAILLNAIRDASDEKKR